MDAQKDQVRFMKHGKFFDKAQVHTALQGKPSKNIEIKKITFCTELTWNGEWNVELNRFF